MPVNVTRNSISLGRDWGVLGWDRNGMAVFAESWSPLLIAKSGLMNQIG